MGLKSKSSGNEKLGMIIKIRPIMGLKCEFNVISVNWFFR